MLFKGIATKRIKSARITKIMESIMNQIIKLGREKLNLFKDNTIKIEIN